MLSETYRIMILVLSVCWKYEYNLVFLYRWRNDLRLSLMMIFANLQATLSRSDGSLS
jgi:hypothetical protein